MAYSADSFTAGEVPTTTKWNKLWSNDADFDARLALIAIPGLITPYGGSSAPSGWLIADGSAVSRTTYAALFAIIGTVFGSGDGSTTFNLPNLKGRVPVGKDSGQTEFDVVGETGGAKTHTLTTTEMPAHTHAFSIFAVGSSNGVHVAAASGTIVSGPTTNDSNVSTGGGGAHNNLQPYIALNYLIKT